MVKASTEITALLIGGIWLYSKFKNPIDTAVNAVNEVADVAAQAGSMAGDTYNYVVNNKKYPVPEEGTFKRDVYDSAKYSARLTTTAYDNTRNFIVLQKDRALRFFGDGPEKTTLERFRQSFNNSKYVGVKDVRSTIIQNNESQVVGSYNNVLGVSMGQKATQTEESVQNNKVVKIARKTSSRKSSSLVGPTKPAVKAVPVLKNVTTFKPSVQKVINTNKIVSLLY